MAATRRIVMAQQYTSCVQGVEHEEDKDRPLPGSLPAELPNGRVPRLESSKGWGRLDLPQQSQAQAPEACCGMLSFCVVSHWLSCRYTTSPVMSSSSGHKGFCMTGAGVGNMLGILDAVVHEAG